MIRSLLIAAMFLAGSNVLAQEPNKGSAQAQEPARKQTPAPKPAPAPKPTKPKADADKQAPAQPLVKIETTLGDFVLELDARKAPITVANFLTYVNEKYYNGTIFYRIKKDKSEQKIQGGGVTPEMEKKKKKKDKFEEKIQGGGVTPEMERKTDGLHPPIKSEWGNGLTNQKWTIAMVRNGTRRDSAEAEFYINVADNTRYDQPKWDGAGYTVFGKVVQGTETIEKILNTKLHKHPKYPRGGKVVPVEPVVIKSARVVKSLDVKKEPQKPGEHATKHPTAKPSTANKELPGAGPKKGDAPRKKSTEPLKPAKPGKGD